MEPEGFHSPGVPSLKKAFEARDEKIVQSRVGAGRILQAPESAKKGPAPQHCHDTVE